MRLLLDTCIIIDAAEVNGLKRLSREVRSLLLDESNELLMSTISMSEIAIKASIGKLNLPDAGMLQVIDDLRLTYLLYSPRHALQLHELPLHHREPLDRMLIGVALAEGLPIVTSDRQFERYSDVGLEVIRA